MYNLVVCDDDEKFLNYVSEKLELFKKFNVICYSDIDKFISEINNLNVDVILMDIELNSKMNGIELIKKINDENIEVVYITGYNKYCTSVYETKHTYFLVKPFTDKQFSDAMKTVIAHLAKKDRKSVVIKVGTNYKKINLKDIYYVESNKRKIIIHLKNESLELYYTLPQLLKELNSDFISCHKSFIVNLEKVNEMSNSSFTLVNKHIIPISQNKYKEAKNYFLNYIKEIN